MAGTSAHSTVVVAHDVGLVALGVDAKLDLERGAALARLARDEHRLARRELAVEARRADADPLLAARLLEPVELRPVEELGEDLRDLRLDDPRPVVLDDDAEARRRGGRHGGDVVLRAGRRRLADLDQQIGQDAGLLAGVEGVVDGFLHRREQGLGRVVEAEQVAVLGEELADRDLPLARRHRLGGGPAAGRRGLVARRRGLRRRRRTSARVAVLWGLLALRLGHGFRVGLFAIRSWRARRGPRRTHTRAIR